MRFMKSILVLLVLAAVSACSGAPNRDQPGGFGYSVRNMIRAQAVTPGVATTPLEPAAVDGAKVEQALKGYRSDHSKGAAGTSLDSSDVESR